MKKNKPKFLYDGNKKVGVIISLKSLDQIYEELEDYYDYVTVKEHENKKEKTYTHNEVKQILLRKKQ